MNKILLLALTLFMVNLIGQQLPYKNPELSSEERAKDLISRLTLEEKVTLMCDVSDAVPRLGIKNFNWWSEALHGLANNSNVTVFPQPIGMAASFNDDLVYRVFDATSDEIRAKYHQSIRDGEKNTRFLSLSIWTPNINIFRDPRWGRGPETYGEDPYLTSRMGIAVVNGLQGPYDSRYKKLLACAKHFAVHSGPEWSRHYLNINTLDPRDLWETYLPAFKALVQQADVREVMCAYQRLDDEPCCGNTRLLQNILRDDWGFKYLVVSDCDAISDFYRGHEVSSDPMHAAAKGVLAGTDVECAWINYPYQNLTEAVNRGLITENEIDIHLMRILIGRFDLGEFDNDSLVSWTKIPYDVINSEAHQKLSLKMARESMVLLQNKNNLLPLSKSIKKIAVLGPNADDVFLMWGSYNGIPNQTSTILDGIKTKLPKEDIIFDPDCDIIDAYDIENCMDECTRDNRPGMLVTYWNNREFKGEAAAVNQQSIPFELSAIGGNTFCADVHQKVFSGKYETIYTPKESGQLAFRLKVCGWAGLYVNGDTLTECGSWKPMLSRATYQVEKNKQYKITLLYKQNDNWPAVLSLDFGKKVPMTYESILRKLNGCDVVVFAGGISSQLEGEEMPVKLPGFKHGDRTDIELPSVQREFLRVLKQAGKKIVFVNCSGSAIALTPETESCDAILQAWYGGEAGGQAVADVLFGDYNPSGKLPITFYKDTEQLPDFEDYSMKDRTYRFISDPLFPFGYGLSYSTFKIGEAKLSQTTIAKDESIDLKIPVTNTGQRDGKEVVQVYVRKVNDTDGPLKTLKGFKKIEVEAGKSNQAIICLPSGSFESYDRASGKMVVAAGEYEVMYGNSSDEKNLKLTRIRIK
jgi:beta-glucosidase